jgi:Mycobacterium membrane protein
MPRWIWVVIGVPVVLVVVVVVVALLPGNRWFWRHLSASGPQAITYRVDGNGPATVSYLDAQGRSVTTSVTLPWETTITIESGSAVAVRATADTDSLDCKVTWEGHSIALDLERGNGNPTTCSADGTA